MKTAALIVTFSVLATSATAQYIPPARDFAEGVRLSTECARAIEPGLKGMRDQHEVLTLLNRVQRQLADDNASALTSALDSIDEFLRLRQQADVATSDDMQRHIRRVRERITDTQNGPPPTDLRGLREAIHHEHIHALQKLVLTNATQLQGFADSQQYLARLINTLIRESVNAASGGSTEVKR